MSQRGSGFERIASDEYMTPHWAVQELIQALHLDTGVFWDPACGTQNIINAIAQMLDTGNPLAPVRMLATDIQPKYDPSGQGVDFTNGEASFMFPKNGPLHIITNPPYGTQGRVAIEFIEEALAIIYASRKNCYLHDEINRRVNEATK